MDVPMSIAQFRYADLLNEFVQRVFTCGSSFPTSLMMVSRVEELLATEEKHF